MKTLDVGRLEVYHIKDIGDGKKSIWTKIGSAFVNKDGSINAFLEAMPIDGRIHLRAPRKEAKSE